MSATEEQRLRFYRALYRTRRLHDGLEPHPTCARCRRPILLDAVSYAGFVQASDAEWELIVVQHAACGCVMAVEPMSGRVAG